MTFLDVEDVCPPPCIHPTDILSVSEVRGLAGVKHRGTLIQWRESRGFPEPIKVFPGPGGLIELWDARAVRTWLDRRRR